MEDEWGPGQCEFTFDPQLGLTAADSMLLFRTATKQICRRLGYHATFMCRPALRQLLLQRLAPAPVAGSTSTAAATRSPTGPTATRPSPTWAALLRRRRARARRRGHASSPRRRSTATSGFKPFSFAPDRASWAVENRGADDPGHRRPRRREHPPGEPGRRAGGQPVPLMASQIVCGLDGIDRKLGPGPARPEPYARRPPDAADQPRRGGRGAGSGGRRCSAAPSATPSSTTCSWSSGHELGRFLAHVTDWEQREYFEVY